jgi:hypothetical protein
MYNLSNNVQQTQAKSDLSSKTKAEFTALILNNVVTPTAAA